MSYRIYPDEYCQKAINATNSWWDSFAETNTEYYEIDFGQLKICLYGSPEIAKNKYMERHDSEIPSPVGCCWAGAGDSFDSAKFEIWLPFIKTNSGNLCINEWEGGHELMHCIDMAFRLMGKGSFGNPDEAINKKFYSPV
jgi:hypothetical protein